MTSACSLSAGQPAGTAAARAAAAVSPFTPGSIGANGPVVGVNLYAVKNYTAAQATADAERTLSYIKNVLHADVVDIVWNMYNPTPTASTVVTDPATTLTAADVGIVTKLALSTYHLHVEYRPMMFVQKDTHWSGTINPANPAAWFGNYYKQNVPYLKVAQQYHISEYVMATEMVDLTPQNKLWAALFAESAKVYGGQISVTAHQAYYFPPHFKVPATRLTGFDFYEPLKLPGTASLAQVVAAYEKFFVSTPAAQLRRTAIQETGIAAVNGGYQNPSDIALSGTINQTVQYNYFIAGCDAVHRFGLRGIFFWKVDLADFPLTPAGNTGNFEGRKGAAAIAECQSILHPPAPPAPKKRVLKKQPPRKK
jgi:hypothetical protein